MKMVKLVMFAGYKGGSFSYNNKFSFSKYDYYLRQSNSWSFYSPFDRDNDNWIRSFCWSEDIILSRIKRKFK